MDLWLYDKMDNGEWELKGYYVSSYELPFGNSAYLGEIVDGEIKGKVPQYIKGD